MISASPTYLLQTGHGFREVEAHPDPKSGILFHGDIPLYDLATLKSLPKTERADKFAAIKAGKKTRKEAAQLKKESADALGPTRDPIKKSKAELKDKQEKLSTTIDEYQSNPEPNTHDYENIIAQHIHAVKQIRQERKPYEAQAAELKSEHKKRFSGLEDEKKAHDLTYTAPELKPFALRVLDGEFNFTDHEKNLLKDRIQHFKAVPAPEEVKSKISRLEGYFAGKAQLYPKDQILKMDADSSILYFSNRLLQTDAKRKSSVLRDWIKLYSEPRTSPKQIKVLSFLVKQFNNISDVFYTEELFTKAKNHPELNQTIISLFKRSEPWRQELCLGAALRSCNHELLEKFLALYNDTKQLEDFNRHKQLDLRYYSRLDNYNLWTHILDTDLKSFEILCKHYGQSFIDEILDFTKPEYNTIDRDYGDLKDLSYNAIFFYRAIENNNPKLAKLIWTAIPNKPNPNGHRYLYSKKDIYKKIESGKSNCISLALNAAVENGSTELVETILKLMPSKELKYELIKNSSYKSTESLDIFNTDHAFVKNNFQSESNESFKTIYAAVRSGKSEIALTLLAMLNPEERNEFYNKANYEFSALLNRFFIQEDLPEKEFESTKTLLNEFLLNQSPETNNLFLNYFSRLIIHQKDKINYQTLYEWLRQIPEEQKAKILEYPKLIFEIIKAKGNEPYKHKLVELFNRSTLDKLLVSPSNNGLEEIFNHPEFAEYFINESDIKTFISKAYLYLSYVNQTLLNHADEIHANNLSDFLIKTSPTVIDKVINYYKEQNTIVFNLIIENLGKVINKTLESKLDEKLKTRIEQNIIHIVDKYLDPVQLQKLIQENKLKLLRNASNANLPILVNALINRISNPEEKNPLSKIMQTYNKLALVLSLSLMMEDYHHYAQARSSVDDKAFDLANLFEGDYKSACDFILNKYPKWLGTSSKQPIHDTLLKIKGPNEISGWEKNKWRDLLEKQIASPKKADDALVSDLVGGATKVQTVLSQMQKAGRGLNLRTLSPAEIKSIIAKIPYAKLYEDPELANICLDINPQPSEGSFNKAILVRKNIKAKLNELKANDQIPELGTKLDSGLNVLQIKNHPDYYMMKMDRLDPRILFIGNYVGCCNSIGDYTEAMAIAQASSPNGGCYVLFKKSGEDLDPINDTIIAKTSVWKSKEGNIVFNSWESTQGDTEVEEDFVNAAGLSVLESDPSIKEVKLGRNRFEYNLIRTSSDKPIEAATASYDSDTQYLVASREPKAETVIAKANSQKVSRESRRSSPRPSHSSSKRFS